MAETKTKAKAEDTATATATVEPQTTRKRAATAVKAPATRATTAANAATPAARAPRTTRARAAIAEAEPRTPNYALRLTEALDDDPTRSPSFALRLNEALEAISAAQPDAPRRGRRAARGHRLDLPPIRLPLLPPIPWRVGLPLLVLLVVAMGVMSRSAAHADAPGVQLPAQQPYAVQLQAPLFTHGLATDASAPTTTSASPSDAATTAAAQADVPVAEPQAPVGVPEPAGLGGDLVDIGIKLVAVLALAYGSLLLLKRFGVGGLSASSRAAGPTPGIRVVSSVSLAPNRSVHLVAVPGGKTLLLGATPTAVNLLTELSPED